MKAIYGDNFSPEYTRSRITADYEKRFAEYKTAERHAHYSQRCETCGKTFTGDDWWRARTCYCSKTCELAQYDKISYSRKYEIEMFWRYFGDTIHPWEVTT